MQIQNMVKNFNELVGFNGLVPGVLLQLHLILSLVAVAAAVNTCEPRTVWLLRLPQQTSRDILLVLLKKCNKYFNITANKADNRKKQQKNG